MKTLTTADIFAALRIVKTANLREQLKPIMRKAAEGKTTVEDIGIEAILAIIEGIAEAKAEKAFYDFLASPFEMTAAEVAALSPAELVGKLKQLKEENDLKNFITSLSGLITSN